MLKAFLAGNLTHDVELREVTKDKDKFKVTTLSIACNHGQDKVSFIDVEIWNKQAEACAAHLKKGSGVAISGNLEIEIYEKDGAKHKSIKVTNPDIKFTDKVDK